MAMLLLTLSINTGCASWLPKSSWKAAADNRQYDGQLKGYSASKYYSSPVGYYVAEVKHYSDVAEICAGREIVYGTMNVRRPLLYDDSVFVKERGIYSEDSWFRQGTVFVVAQHEGDDKKSVKASSEQAVGSKKPEGNQQPSAAGKAPGAAPKEVSTEGGNQPIIRPISRKDSGNRWHVAGRSREMVLISIPVYKPDKDAIEESLGDALKGVDLRGDEVARVVGHLEANGEEKALAEIANYLKSKGIRDVEVYNVGKFGVEGEVSLPVADVMVIRRELVKSKDGDRKWKSPPLD